jgi:hypothetical protein
VLAILVVAGVIAYAATRPTQLTIARSAHIAAPPGKNYPLINDMHHFNRWNPFLKNDPAAKLTYSRPSTGKGAAHDSDAVGRKRRLKFCDAKQRTLSARMVKSDYVNIIYGSDVFHSRMAAL